MKKNDIFKPILFVLGIAFLTSGCSSLGPSAGQDPSFRQKVAPAHLAQPLPVEIAKDI